MNKITKVIALNLLILLLLTTIVFAADITCFEVGWWNEGTGEPLCGIACSDGTLYQMDCDADIFN